MLYDTKDNEEEASLGHKGESSLSKSSDSSDDEDEEDDGTGAKDINGNSDGDGVSDRNTGVGRGSAEWLRFFSPEAQTEALGDMEKSKLSSLTASIKKLKLGKSKSKISRKGKTDQKSVKDSSKTLGRKKRRFTKG